LRPRGSDERCEKRTAIRYSRWRIVALAPNCLSYIDGRALIGIVVGG
jgi:hypothetical protein